MGRPTGGYGSKRVGPVLGGLAREVAKLVGPKHWRNASRVLAARFSNMETSSRKQAAQRAQRDTFANNGQAGTTYADFFREARSLGATRLSYNFLRLGTGSSRAGWPAPFRGSRRTMDAESVEQRRLRKRHASVAAIMRTPEFIECQRLGLHVVGPDPADLAVSKRRFERSIQDWRRALKALAGMA